MDDNSIKRYGVLHIICETPSISCVLYNSKLNIFFLLFVIRTIEFICTYVVLSFYFTVKVRVINFDSTLTGRTIFKILNIP